jgi:C_GCAxxG_C_C family probable redox protein
MTTRSDRAVAYFKEGFSCSQAVLASYAQENGLTVEQALKVAGAFGGGMGRMGDTCGAVTGAFMVIGLKYGKTRADDEPSKENAYRLVQEFAKRFRSRHGSIVCRDLLSCDLSTPEGRKTAAECHLTETRCPLFVQDAVEILEKIFKEKRG